MDASSRKALQKIFYFSDPVIKTAVDRRTGEIARQERVSSSRVIEQALLDRFFPRNEDARFLIINKLYGNPENSAVNSVSEILDHLFRYNVSGINFGPRHDNFRPLLDYCLRFCGDGTVHSSGRDDPIVYHFLKSWSSVVKRIEVFLASCEDDELTASLDNVILLGKKYLDIANNNPQNLVVFYLLEVIRDAWPALHDYALTYSALSDIAVLNQGWEDTDRSHDELVNVVCEISEDW